MNEFDQGSGRQGVDSAPMKYIILVGDGMGDLPMAELNDATPLEKAVTPAMDFISSHGQLGLLQTIPAGYPPGSDVANLSLLGYDPEKYYTGRAPLEAASLGVNLAADEIAFRCNLVTIDYENDNHVKMVDYSAGHIDTETAGQLIEALEDKLGSATVRFYPGVSYRHLMVFKGPPPRFTTVPPHDHTGKDVSVFWQDYLQSSLSGIVIEACGILKAHAINIERVGRHEKPANAIWLWGEGKPPDMPAMTGRYNIKGSLISAVDLLKGLGVYAGLEIIKVPGATGYLDTNYAGKAAAALDTLVDKDFVFVHVEAPDEASHQGLLQEKIRAIEDFDREIVRPVLEGLRKMKVDFRLVVAMDHFTPLSTRTHADRPVPVALYDSREENSGSGLAYNEKNAMTTGVYHKNGEIFIASLFDKLVKT